MEEKIAPFVFREEAKQANDKPDNGEFFRFAWRVSEALYKSDFSKVQHRLIHYVIRKTWGWNKKTFIFSLAKASEEMGIPRPHLSGAYHALIKADVLRTDRGEVGFNKYSEEWNLEYLKEQRTSETKRAAGCRDRKRTVTDAVKDDHHYGCRNESITDAVTTITDAVTERGPKPASEDASSDPYRHSLIDKEIDNPPNPPEGGKRRRSIPELHRFDEFWAAYPKKSTKAQCIDWWKRQKPDDGLIDQILSALEAYKDSRDVKRGFILDPIRFLKYKRWEDEALQAPDDDFWSADRFKRGSQ